MIIDLLSPKPGTYAGVNVDQRFIDGYTQFASDVSYILPKMLEPSNIHSTLLFSFKHLPNYDPIEYSPALDARILGYMMWETKSRNDEGERTKCLVLAIDCPLLKDRHLHLMNEHNATYTFKEFIPHITLSYDVGNDFDVTQLPQFQKYTESFQYIREYKRDIDLDYVKR